jgi:hypothetical protein
MTKQALTFSAITNASTTKQQQYLKWVRVLVYAALSYWCMRPETTPLLRYETFSVRAFVYLSRYKNETTRPYCAHDLTAKSAHSQRNTRLIWSCNHPCALLALVLFLEAPSQTNKFPVHASRDCSLDSSTRAAYLSQVHQPLPHNVHTIWDSGRRWRWNGLHVHRTYFCKFLIFFTSIDDGGCRGFSRDFDCWGWYGDTE